MAINKVPNNYYNDTNIRRDKINTIIDHVNELDTHAVVPTPAAGDVGKVIKVGSDGYELASDAGAKLVTATVTADGQGNLSCDKTYAELSASIANGDIVELVYTYQTFVFSGIDFTGIHFMSARNDGVVHNVITAWTISSSNVITFLIEGMNSELPTYSSADEGKFLGVNAQGQLGFFDKPSSDIVGSFSLDGDNVCSIEQMDINIPANAKQLTTNFIADLIKKIDTISLPASLERLGPRAFDECSGLTEIIIPASVNYIGSYCFNDCTSLMSITFLSVTPPTLQTNCLLNVPANCDIYVPAESIETYKSKAVLTPRSDYIHPIT